jgi:hypothetical protein
MNNKEQFDFYVANGLFKETTAEMRIQSLINTLIEALYIPVEEFKGLTKLDTERIKHFEIDDREPINWGDLKCNEVVKLHEEAAMNGRQLLMKQALANVIRL